MCTVLIIGATSAIAEAVTREYAKRGYKLVLVARDKARLEIIASDLSIRGASSISHYCLDVNEHEEHEKILTSIFSVTNSIDIVLLAYGTLADQAACESSSKQALYELNTNLLSAVSIIGMIANHFEVQRHGTIAVITSVAGDRGRQSNYIYCTAKAGLTVFLQGLRNRLHKSGVHVLTIKPGFVDTPMTEKFSKGALWTSPVTIAAGIVRAIDSEKDIVYLPWYWRYIMLMIRLIPERLFKRMSL